MKPIPNMTIEPLQQQTRSALASTDNSKATTELQSFFDYFLNNELPKGQINDVLEKNFAVYAHETNADLNQIKQKYVEHGWPLANLQGWLGKVKAGEITELNTGEIRLWCRKYLPDKEKEFFENDVKASQIYGSIEKIIDLWENDKDTDDALHYFFALLNKSPDLKRNHYLKLLAKKCDTTITDLVKKYHKWIAQNTGIEKQTYKEIPKEELEILRDVELLQKITSELDKTISGEDDIKRTTSTVVCGGRLVINISPTSINLLFSSTTGAGKDFVIGELLKLLPKEFVIKRTRISPTALNYLHNKEREPNWTWDGKVLYLEDISNQIFNHEVFKVLTSNHGGTCTITIDGEAKDVTQVGKPVVVCTAARLIMEQEMERRFRLLSLDETEEATIAIVKKCAESEQAGGSEQYDSKMINAQRYLKRVTVHLPFAELLPFAIPNNNMAWRTISKVWFDYIKCSAALHQYQRETNEKAQIVATEKDYELGTEAFLQTLQNVQAMPLTRRAKDLLEGIQRACSKIPETDRKHATVSEIEQEVAESKIYDLLNKLDKFLEKTRVKLDDNKQKLMAYRVREEFISRPSLPLTYVELVELAEKRVKAPKGGKAPKQEKGEKEEKVPKVEKLLPLFPLLPSPTGVGKPQNSLNLFTRTDKTYLDCSICQKSKECVWQLNGSPCCDKCKVDTEKGAKS